MLSISPAPMGSGWVVVDDCGIVDDCDAVHDTEADAAAAAAEWAGCVKIKLRDGVAYMQPADAAGVWVLHPHFDDRRMWRVTHRPTGAGAGPPIENPAGARKWFERLVRVALTWGQECAFGEIPSEATMRRLQHALAEDDGGAAEA